MKHPMAFVLGLGMWSVGIASTGLLQMLALILGFAWWSVWLAGALDELFPQLALHERLLRRVAGKPLRKGELPASQRKVDWDAIENMCKELDIEPLPKDWD